MDVSGGRRTDTASRMVAAAPGAIYRAFLDPEAWLIWLPPDGMSGEMHTFDARESGAYHMSLTYDRSKHAAVGKTSEHVDVFEGRFVELVSEKRIVQVVEFVSDDPAFAGEMRMTWSLKPVPRGTEVTIICENVPAGIRRDDHEAGLQSTLSNLAAYVE